MDERRLITFRSVAEQQNFSRAAAILHLSQPTVSQQIQQLEESLGVRLLDRTTHGVTLTPAGQALYQRSGLLLTQFAEARRAVLSAAGAMIGPLVVGASLTIGEYMLPRAVALFRTKAPQVEVQLSIVNTQRIAQQVLEGTLDLGLVEGPVEAPELTQEEFQTDELVVIAPPNHPWQAKAELTVQDLVGEPMLVREPGSGTRRIMADFLAATGIQPSAVHVVGQLSGFEAIKGAVEAGMGVAVLSEWTVQKEMKLGTLLVRRMAGAPMRRSLRLIYPTGRTLTPAAVAFAALVRSGEMAATWARG